MLSSRKRVAIAAGVAAMHLVVLWLVLHFSGLIGPPVRPVGNLTTVEIADVPVASAPAAPAPVPPVPDPHIAVRLPSAIAMPVPPAAAGNGTGEGCGMPGLVGRAILASPDAMASLSALPADVRTKADAVMLWNGGWIDVGGAPAGSLVSLVQADPLAALKATVVAALAAAPSECRDLGVSGPQLIPIPEATRTTMLVIGSGQWKWTDLVDPAVMPAESSAPSPDVSVQVAKTRSP